jgi:hypothetical protein
MPLQYREELIRYPKESLELWKDNEKRTYTFIEEKDITLSDGTIAYLCIVERDGEKRELWFKPHSAMAIGLQTVAPLTGKTLTIVKTTGKELRDTRYKVVARAMKHVKDET